MRFPLSTSPGFLLSGASRDELGFRALRVRSHFSGLWISGFRAFSGVGMVLFVCRGCDGEFEHTGRGRPPFFHSVECRPVVPAVERPLLFCRVCGVVIPQAATGRPRVYCSPSCASEGLAQRRAAVRDHLRVRDLEHMDAAGVPQDRYLVEKPLSRAPVDRNMLGAGDIDLAPYMDQDWAVQFVSEFGYSGCDVGQTYPNAGRTLGSD